MKLLPMNPQPPVIRIIISRCLNQAHVKKPECPALKNAPC
jgi:hypothetical protein